MITTWRLDLDEVDHDLYTRTPKVRRNFSNDNTAVSEVWGYLVDLRAVASNTQHLCFIPSFDRTAQPLTNEP